MRHFTLDLRLHPLLPESLLSLSVTDTRTAPRGKEAAIAPGANSRFVRDNQTDTSPRARPPNEMAFASRTLL